MLTVKWFVRNEVAMGLWQRTRGQRAEDKGQLTACSQQEEGFA